MLWIKRNLFLAVSGLVAIALLGGGGFYVYSGLGRNAELDAEVGAKRTILTDLYNNQPVFPNAANIAAAKAEAARLHAEINKALKDFAPVATEKLDSRSFSKLRDNTLDELRALAAKSNVKLPDSLYAFSFQTQKSKTEFAPDTFPLVPEQLMEITALCRILFDARINQINTIRRARVSLDDKKSSNSGDYLSPLLANDLVTTAQAASHPYEFTFCCFTAELAVVLNKIQQAPHGFVIKAMMVEPDASAPGVAPGAATGSGTGTTPEVVRPPRPRGDRFNPNPPQVAPPRNLPPPARAAAGDKVVYVLKEKRLKVTMLVYVIKPARSS